MHMGHVFLVLASYMWINELGGLLLEGPEIAHSKDQYTCEEARGTRLPHLECIDAIKHLGNIEACI